MFIKRSYQKEMMDDFSYNDGRIGEAIRELHIINRLLGGNSVSRKGLKYFDNGSSSDLTILDIGGGGSDILYDLKFEKKDLKIYSVDRNKYSCHYQKNGTGNNKIICADAFKLPVREKSFDLVHASLFFHHFSENEAVQLIKYFLEISRRGIIINDLRRNLLAYTGIKILTVLFSKSEFVKNDGPMSVRRAFTKKDLLYILSQSGINNYLIKRMWAFRFLLIIPVSENE